MTPPQVDPAAGPFITRTRGAAGQAHVRRANISLVLGHLRAHGGRSRAQLAAETGLSKATVSSLVVELIDRGLVLESEVHRSGAVGRPGLMVEVDGRSVCGLGVAVHVEYLALVAIDLQGEVLDEKTAVLPVADLSSERVLDELAGLITTAHTELKRRGIATIATGAAVPGVIDLASGHARFAPNIGWEDVPVRAGLAERTGLAPATIHVENDAKMAAIAEYAALAGQGISDVLYLTGDVGTGAGIISDGVLMRGWSGFAGDVGHLTLNPAMTPCTCGRHGCWETQVGLHAFLGHACDEHDPARDPAIGLDARMQDLITRADQGDPQIHLALRTLATDLAAGLSPLIDILNPEAVILGGYFGFAADHLLDPISEILAARWVTPGSQAQILGSRLGLLAAARGGAQNALDSIYADPGLVDVRP